MKNFSRAHILPELIDLDLEQRCHRVKAVIKAWQDEPEQQTNERHLPTKLGRTLGISHTTAIRVCEEGSPDEMLTRAIARRLGINPVTLLYSMEEIHQLRAQIAEVIPESTPLPLDTNSCAWRDHISSAAHQYAAKLGVLEQLRAKGHIPDEAYEQAKVRLLELNDENINLKFGT